MMWDKPFELTEEEYKIIYKCLNLSKCNVRHEDGCVMTCRKTTGELILAHFFPNADTITYNKENEIHTYYQTSRITDEERIPPEKMPREIVLDDPKQVQALLTELSRLQKELAKANETV